MRSLHSLLVALPLVLLPLSAVAPAAAQAPAVVTPQQAGVDYDIVYVRQPRFGDNVNTWWPEVFHPTLIDPGADLMLLHPDGTEQVLVDCEVDPLTGVGDSVTDPFLSFDARYVYYSRFYDVVPPTNARVLPMGGSDIFRFDLLTGQSEQLTFVRDPLSTTADLRRGEFIPNTGAGAWRQTQDGAYQPVAELESENSTLGGIFNLGPSPLSGGRIAFTSNRRGIVPPRGFTQPSMQIFVMDEDGKNVECVAPMNLSGALHPFQLSDGRVAFSSHESQGVRDKRLWGLWVMNPDGKNWEPLASAFNPESALHFATQMSDGSLVVIDYYNLNNNGFGAPFRFPVDVPAGTPRFSPAELTRNPPLQRVVSGGFSFPFFTPFTPHGYHALTPFTHPDDAASPPSPTGVGWMGKFTHPSAAPDGQLLIAWTDGPANNLRRPVPTPYYDSGIHIWQPTQPGQVMNSPAEMLCLKNDPNFNEAWPRAVVPYAAIHGIDEPAELDFGKNDGSLRAELPVGTPYGLIGASSVIKRETAPANRNLAAPNFDGLEPMNSANPTGSFNWRVQGADAGRYDDADIHAVRLLAMEPNSDRARGPFRGRQYFSYPGERLRILGEVPLRKVDSAGAPIIDVEGNPDTSFLFKIPADTPFTFQTLDRRGLVLNMSQTWHQLRPGEVHHGCSGCHAHSEQELPFSATEAALPRYHVRDLSNTTPLVVPPAGPSADPGLVEVPSSLVDVEFIADIRPILEGACVSCHSGPPASAPAGLVFDDLTPHNGLPGDYARLAADPTANWGIPPVIEFSGGPAWRGDQVSRYVRVLQSRRSLLVWKIFGERLDGWSNGDWPTESVRGDVSTLPVGADPNLVDIDFDGVVCPPPGSGGQPLSGYKRATVARWIDLGCPIDLVDEGDPKVGWFLDENRPTVAVTAPRRGLNLPPPTEIRIGVADANSGLVMPTFSVTADFAVNGALPGTELAPMFNEVDPGVFVLPLQGVSTMASATLVVSIEDRAGNEQRVEHEFSVFDAQQAGQQNRPRARMKIEGVGSEAVPGPFPVSVGIDVPFAVDVWGPPLGQAYLWFGTINPAGVPLFDYGLLKHGTPPGFGEHNLTKAPLVLDKHGHGQRIMAVPSPTPLGPVIGVQGVCFDPATFEVRMTAAFQLIAE